MNRLPALVLLGIGVAALAAGPGCGMPISERVVEVTNRCESDADCGSSGRCIETACVSTAADLLDVVIQIDVPPGAAYAPSTTHMRAPRKDDLILSGESSGFYEPYNLGLLEMVDVVVTMAVQDMPSGCVETTIPETPPLADADGNLPIRVELIPTHFYFGAIPPGVPATVYDASTPDTADTHEVSISVPLGTYDVYVTPIVPVDAQGSSLLENCELPPRLVSGQVLPQTGPGEVFTLRVDVDASPDPSDANDIIGSILGPELVGWTVDLIENKRGRVISSTAKLELAVDDMDPTTGTGYSLVYWAENGSSEDKVLRLTPPEEEAADGMPVFYWRLFELFSNPDVSTLNVNLPIDVSANVVTEDTAEPVPAIVTFHSDELFIDFGDNVLYRRTVQTRADGSIGGPTEETQLLLLPGNYTVVIQPLTGDTLAVSTQTLKLSKADQGGKTLYVKRKRTLSGSATTAQGVAAARMNTVVEPTVPSAATYLQSVRESLPVLPGTSSVVTDDQGGFALHVDFGEFNLSIRPENSSGLPWAVLSRFDPATTTSALQLGIPNPVVLWGQVRSPSPNSIPIAGARVRAWISPSPTPSELEGAPDPTVIQIAETTSDENGLYRLFLPASIAASISQ